MRIVLAVLCALVAPLTLRAQTPTPASSQEPALQPLTLLEMSHAAVRPAWEAPAAFNDAFLDAKAEKRKSTGKLLMIIGGGAIVAGAVVGGGGGAALIVAGILTGGYGFWLFQEPAK